MLIISKKLLFPILLLITSMGTLIGYKLIEDNNGINDTRQEVEYDGSDDYAYVKPAGEEDIASSVGSFDTGQIEIKYVKNQILFFGRDGTDFEDVKHMLKKYDGIIVGYLASVNSYQVEFLNCNYTELDKIAELLNQEELVESDSAGVNMVIEYELD